MVDINRLVDLIPSNVIVASTKAYFSPIDRSNRLASKTKEPSTKRV